MRRMTTALVVGLLLAFGGQAFGLTVGPGDGPYLDATKAGFTGPYLDNYMTLSDGWDGVGLGSVTGPSAVGYYFANSTPDMTVAAQQASFTSALAQWSAIAQVDFTQVFAISQSATIDIGFYTGDHGCGFPFDGPGGVLGHTFYPSPPNAEPIAGDAHFDDAETWTAGGGGGTFSLDAVALHELGHALGVAHSNDPASVMWPFYGASKTTLTEDDINAMRSLYAVRGTIPNPNAYFGITHTWRSDLEVEFGVGAHGSPDHLMTLVDMYGSQLSSTDDILAAGQYVSGPLSEAALRALLTPSTSFWLRVRDLWGLDTGTLDSFGLILDGYDISYGGSPIAIPDGPSGAWVYIDLEVPDRQYPIPEPATCALFLAGLVGAGVVRRRRKRAA